MGEWEWEYWQYHLDRLWIVAALVFLAGLVFIAVLAWRNRRK
jgi:hypothetical protein